MTTEHDLHSGCVSLSDALLVSRYSLALSPYHPARTLSEQLLLSANYDGPPLRSFQSSARPLGVGSITFPLSRSARSVLQSVIRNIKVVGLFVSR